MRRRHQGAHRREHAAKNVAQVVAPDPNANAVATSHTVARPHANRRGAPLRGSGPVPTRKRIPAL